MNPVDLSNDADPRFVAEFYKNLKILSQDLYKKSAAAENAKQQMGSNSATTVGGGMTMMGSNSKPSLGFGGFKATSKGARPSPNSRASFNANVPNNYTSANLRGSMSNISEQTQFAMDAAVAALAEAGGSTDDGDNQGHDLFGLSMGSQLQLVKPMDYFSPDKMMDRMKKYADMTGQASAHQHNAGYNSLGSPINNVVHHLRNNDSLEHDHN